jgi:hypothetical protein
MKQLLTKIIGYNTTPNKTVYRNLKWHCHSKCPPHAGVWMHHYKDYKLTSTLALNFLPCLLRVAVLKTTKLAERGKAVSCRKPHQDPRAGTGMSPVPSLM